MTEPGAGSDLRGMKTTAVAAGDDFVINGTKHFISHADHSDYVILFAATRRGSRRARQAQENDRISDRHGTSGLRGAARLQQRFASRLHQQHSRVQRLPGAEVGGARRSAPGLRGRQHLARRHAAAGRRHLSRARRAGAGAVQAVGRGPRAVRTADRQVSGRELQAGRHGGGIARRGAAWSSRRPGSAIKASLPIWIWRSPSSRPRKCWPWWPTRRCRFTAAWG